MAVVTWYGESPDMETKQRFTARIEYLEEPLVWRISYSAKRFGTPLRWRPSSAKLYVKPWRSSVPEQLVAIHESAHAVLAYRYRIPITSISLVPREEYSGITRFDSSGIEQKDELNCVSLLLAGELAERMAWGLEPRVNWFAADTSDDGDLDKARHFCDKQPDPLWARRVAAMKSHTALMLGWSPVQALADELERRKVLVGAQVDEILRSAGVRRMGEIDPEKRFVEVGGKTVTLRQWSTALDANAKDRARAIRAIKGGKR
jgi:hypothetical protein